MYGVHALPLSQAALPGVLPGAVPVLTWGVRLRVASQVGEVSALHSLHHSSINTADHQHQFRPGREPRQRRKRGGEWEGGEGERGEWGGEKGQWVELVLQEP